MKLEQNYRSTQTILDAAHAVVSRNEGRKEKKLWTDRGAGTAITLFDAYNEYEEAEFVARQVERLTGVGGRSGLSACSPPAPMTSRARCATARSRSPTASTPSAACWRRRSSASGSRTSSSAAPASTSGAR